MSADESSSGISRWVKLILLFNQCFGNFFYTSVSFLLDSRLDGRIMIGCVPENPTKAFVCFRNGSLFAMVAGCKNIKSQSSGLSLPSARLGID